jgi:protease-4
MLAGASLACSIDLTPFPRTEPFEEKQVLGEKGPKLVLIELEGIIAEGQQRGPLGIQSPGLLTETREALDRAARDDDVAGLVLRIRSPGGTVSASETLHHELSRWKQEQGKPIVAYLQGLATSGGYYTALVSEGIVAHPTTVTGSIGVVMLGLNFAGLMSKVGVADQTLTSGRFKDTGSPLRPMEQAERTLLQGVLDDLHERFREVLLDGRASLDAARVDALDDGRIFTARQALDLGLIDAIGYLEDAVALAEQRAGISESRLVVYHRPSVYRANIYGRGPLPAVQVVDVDLLPAGAWRLEPGFYYLWPGILGSSP